jgi:hypothetical protein
MVCRVHVFRGTGLSTRALVVTVRGLRCVVIFVTLNGIPHAHVWPAAIERSEKNNAIREVREVRECPMSWRHWNSRHPLDNIEKCTGQLSGMPKYGEYGGIFLGYNGGA